MKYIEENLITATIATQAHAILTLPRSVLFGGLGVEIASAVVQGITPWDVLYTDDGTLLVEQHPAVNQSRRAFMHPLYCLRQWWGSEGFGSRDASNKTAQSALIKLSAVNVAFRVSFV